MRIHRLSVVVPVLLLGSCGAGTAGIVAGSSSGGGGTTPTITAFRVLNPKVSPSILRVETSADVQAELFYAVGGGQEVAMTKLTGLGATGNSVQFASGVNDLGWDFADQLGGPNFVDDVDIIARRSGGSMIGGGQLRIGFGNDPPEILSIEPVTDSSGEASGTVEVVLALSDSSADVVALQVEWRRLADAPGDWKPASVGGVPGGVETSVTGDAFAFFWKTNEDGLGSADDEFLLRVTADDGTQDNGVPVGIGQGSSPAFRVDNNAAPLAVVDEAGLILNLDGRRGIPIPFTVIDEESDDVRVILQWKVHAGDFPDIGSKSSEELIALVEDPALDAERRALQIGRLYPTHQAGRVGSLLEGLPANQVRLPELAYGSAGSPAAPGLGGRTLEILRREEMAQVSWPRAPTLPSVAAVALDDRSALVLAKGSGGWRVLEVDLTDGSRELFAAGLGAPRAMGMDPLRRHLFVGTDVGVFRLDPSTGVQTGLLPHAFLDELRGLAALGEDVVLITGDDALRRIDFAPGSPAPDVLLLDGLATPWGVVQDPLRTNTVYLAEQGADRVSSLDLQRLVSTNVSAEVRPEDVAALSPTPFPNPRALALERGGGRLLVMTQVDALQHVSRTHARPGSPVSLRGLDLGVARPFVFEITDRPAPSTAGLATGPGGLRIVCSSPTLFLGGGVAQSRAIVEAPASAEEGGPVPYDPSNQVLTVEEDFAPVLEPGEIWRLSAADASFGASSPTGVRNKYLWDSTEASDRVVQVKIIPLDTDVGATTLLSGSKTLGDPFFLSHLGGVQFGAGTSLAVADLDGDGDLDVVTASSGIAIQFQESGGQFAFPVLLSTPGRVRSVIAADLDGDGDLDLASANTSSFLPFGSNLTIFFQESPGQFAELPVVLAEAVSSVSESLTSADLDGDGDLDLVLASTDQSSGSPSTGSLQVFFQESPGMFSGAGVLIGPPMVSLRSVIAADMDGDGLLDLISANAPGLTIHFQESPGQFAAAVVLADPAIAGSSSVVAADLDGDGNLDLATANEGSDSLTILFQQGRGQFTEPALVLVDPAGTNPTWVTTGDLDGDGDLDLVATSDGNDLTVFFQESPGQFSGGVVLSDPGEPLYSVEVADLDADGDLDLVTTGTRSKAFFQPNPGQFAGDAVIVDDPDALSQTVSAADLDGDGDLDLLKGPAIFFQESPGRFAQAAVMLDDPDTTLVGPPFPADLDGDGDLDLVSANDSDGLTLLFQDGPGQFTGRAVLSDPALSVPGGPIAADLDGDGDLDIASTNFVFTSQSSNIAVFFQESPGQFAGEALVLEFPPMSVAGSLTSADLDADGDLDLVVANLLFDGSSNLAIFFQETPGRFAEETLVLDPELPSIASVSAADLDGDGDLDLLAGGGKLSTSVLSLYFQESPGQFSSEPVVLGDPAVRGSLPRAADLDGDGDLDLVATDRQANRLAVFLQEGPGRFSEEAIVLTDSAMRNPGSVFVVDLDGDGELDLATSNGSGNLTIFFGGH